MLNPGNLSAHCQIVGDRPPDLPARQLPLAVHRGQPGRIHRLGHFGIGMLYRANRGGRRILIADPSEQLEGIMQNIPLFLQRRMDYHPSVGDHKKMIDSRNLQKGHMRDRPSQIQPVLLFHQRPEKIAGFHKAFHQEIGPAVAYQLHCGSPALSLSIGRDNCKGIRLFIVFHQQRGDFPGVPNQHRLRNSAVFCIEHRFDYMGIGGAGHRRPARAGVRCGAREHLIEVGKAHRILSFFQASAGPIRNHHPNRCHRGAQFSPTKPFPLPHRSRGKQTAPNRLHSEENSSHRQCTGTDRSCASGFRARAPLPQIFSQTSLHPHSPGTGH